MRQRGPTVGSDQIAEIAPIVREVLNGGPGWLATFEAMGDPMKWVQFQIGTIKAAYHFTPEAGTPMGQAVQRLWIGVPKF